MIALCREHHDKADAGTFTATQLREMKTSQGNRPIEGRFDWLRRDLVIRLGGAFYFNTPVALTFGRHPLIWFTRDEDQHVLLNIKMLSLASMLSLADEPRFLMRDSAWMFGDDPDDVICPTTGRLLDVRYSAGDRVRIEFKNVESAEDAARQFPQSWPQHREISYPTTACDITYRVAETSIDIGPRNFQFGSASLNNVVFDSCGPMSIGAYPGAAFAMSLDSLFPRKYPKVRRNDLCPCGSNTKFKKCHGRQRNVCPQTMGPD